VESFVAYFDLLPQNLLGSTENTTVRLVGHQDCDPAHPEHEEILTLHSGVWCKICKGIFSELRGGRVGGAVQKTLKCRSINVNKL
jgi:hypothetical protein